MISELVYKINAFEGISDVLSEINLSESPIPTPPIGQIQKKFGEFAPLALEQYKLRVKSVQKLPQHARAGCLFWQRAFEQCSSEAVALWKAQAFPVETLLSITGGLGVDEWAWSKNGTHVISCDIQSDLNALVCYRCSKNKPKLGCMWIPTAGRIWSAWADIGNNSSQVSAHSLTHSEPAIHNGSLK
jgi:hypothetical protein